MKNILILLFISLVFTACSKVNVVLLPEANNKIGKIEIVNEKKTVHLDQAYQEVNALDGESTILTQEKVSEKYATVLKSLPNKPKSYLLYFKWDSPKIVPSSKNMLSQIVAQAKKETTLYIDIIGYTDTAGDLAYNKKLSLKRANKISAILQKKGISNDKISIEFYGEANPIIPTKDGVAKKENRRVEVIIK